MVKKRRLFRTIALLLMTVFLLAFLVFSLLYLNAQRQPEFYRELMKRNIEIEERYHRDFLRKISQLHNTVQKTDSPWETQITADELNGYLATELIKPDVHLFPKEGQEPRIRFSQQKIEWACRLEYGSLTGILNVAANIMVLEPNTFLLCIVQSRLGSLPFSKERTANLFAEGLRKKGYSVTMGTNSGNPALTVTIPPIKYEGDKKITIDSLHFTDDTVQFSGRTTKE